MATPAPIAFGSAGPAGAEPSASGTFSCTLVAGQRYTVSACGPDVTVSVQAPSSHVAEVVAGAGSGSSSSPSAGGVRSSADALHVLFAALPEPITAVKWFADDGSGGSEAMQAVDGSKPRSGQSGVVCLSWFLVFAPGSCLS